MLQCDTLDHLTPSLCFLSRQNSFEICGRFCACASVLLCGLRRRLLERCLHLWHMRNASLVFGSQNVLSVRMRVSLKAYADCQSLSYRSVQPLGLTF